MGLEKKKNWPIIKAFADRLTCFLVDGLIYANIKKVLL
jgi:hypothetical protein